MTGNTSRYLPKENTQNIAINTSSFKLLMLKAQSTTCSAKAIIL